MTRYEYKVVPAPTRGLKARTARTPETRFALGVETVLNAMGAQGWQFLRAELLPSDERHGLTGTVQHWRNLLVFSRAIAEVAAEIGSLAPGADPQPAPPPQPEPPAAGGDDDTTDLPAVLRIRAAQQLRVVADTAADTVADTLADKPENRP